MRIISGEAAGRLLKVPPGYDVRPTPDLVRQAVFNSLGERIQGARVLDLFSGAGALGLECLSRGASGILSVEKSSRHAKFIRDNYEALQLERPVSFELRVQDVFTMLGQLAEQGRLFDLVLADPPYGEKNLGRRSTSMAQRLLDDQRLPSLLTLEGLFVLGHTKRDTLALPPVWRELRVLRHGDSHMRFLQKTSAIEALSVNPTSGGN